ncbi:hypothetical protein XF_2356 [Xylella fastidiosa 9a5c]|uniref:Uncharacterized protein n=1 Tax=Xylella fastidiosa (strain 9a5c) TaxID=160492 RepID=Q9PAY9_XYLFA|nr:hypothetical protein XF_2356 [Xylella fastidiosa 9a5c]
MLGCISLNLLLCACVLLVVVVSCLLSGVLFAVCASNQVGGSYWAWCLMCARLSLLQCRVCVSVVL